MSSQLPKKKANVISVSADSGMALSAELSLLRQKFNEDRKSRGTSSKQDDAMSKVYKKGTNKSLKGHKNKLDRVSTLESDA